MFVKVIFIACIVIRLPGSLLIAFGLSNYYWSWSMRISTCVE
jgi:hypothetical protein